MAENQKPSFLSTGKVTISFDGKNFSSARSVLIQNDGKIILAGYSLDGNYKDEFQLARLNPDGSLDTSFGVSGKVQTPNISTSGDWITHAILQSDGKILAIGTAQVYDSENVKYHSDFLIMRYKTDGTLDASFSGGIVHTDFGLHEADLASTVLVQNDNRIVVVGTTYNGQSYDFSLARYNQDGSLDLSFGNNGKVLTDFQNGNEFGNGAVLSSNGKIIIAGSSIEYDFIYGPTFKSFVIARYNDNGTLDTSFGVAGKVFTDFVLNATRLIEQPDGKVIIIGRALNDSIDFAMARYNSDGSIDTSFGQNGRVFTDFQNLGEDGAYSVAIQTDGKIILAGHSIADFAIARYNIDGSLDDSFGNGGKVFTSFDNSFDASYSLAIQPDGKILLAGESYNLVTIKKDFALARYNSDGTLDESFNPHSTLDNVLNIPENWAPVVLDSSVSVYDAELSSLNNGLGNYDGASITLERRGGANSDDIFSTSGSLAFFDSKVLLLGTHVGTVQNINGQLHIVFNSNATQARVNDVLSSITYKNTSESPQSNIYIDWTFNDGNTGAQGSGGSLSITNSVLVTITPTNDAPKLVSSIPDQYVAVGNSYSYSIAKNSFIDVDGDKLTYKSILTNGFLLPDWLTFDPDTQTFKGFPKYSGSYEIYVIATDNAQTVASDYFVLNVVDPTVTYDDILIGGSTNNTLKGGRGDDRYILNISTTGLYEGKVLELKGQGNDTLVYRNEALTAQTKAVTLKLLTNFENLDISATGTMNFNLTGSAGDNTLIGNAGDNLIDGGKGADSMIGGAGNDTYILDNGGDTVQEASGGGVDQVNIKLASNSVYDTYSLDPNIENAVLTNKVAFNLEGNELSNYLKGNGAANSISGNAGNDTIDAGKGKDTIQGGAGDDVLLGGAGADTFVWKLADLGVAGTPSNDITDFKVKDKDVLDLRDLLSGHSEDLSNYLDISLDGTNTKIHISTSGGFANGIYNASQENVTITVTSNLFLSTKSSDETSLLQTLINKHQLLTDY